MTPSRPLWRHCNGPAGLLICWPGQAGCAGCLVDLDGWMDGRLVFIFHVVWILRMHVRAMRDAGNGSYFCSLYWAINRYRYIPANWRSRSSTVRFTCAWNIVFQHKINVFVDVEHMVCFPSLATLCLSIIWQIIFCSCALLWVNVVIDVMVKSDGFRSAHHEQEILNTRWLGCNMNK